MQDGDVVVDVDEDVVESAADHIAGMYRLLRLYRSCRLRGPAAVEESLLDDTERAHLAYVRRAIEEAHEDVQWMFAHCLLVVVGIDAEGMTGDDQDEEPDEPGARWLDEGPEKVAGVDWPLALNGVDLLQNRHARWLPDAEDVRALLREDLGAERIEALTAHADVAAKTEIVYRRRRSQERSLIAEGLPLPPGPDVDLGAGLIGRVDADGYLVAFRPRPHDEYLEAICHATVAPFADVMPVAPPPGNGALHLHFGDENTSRVVMADRLQDRDYQICRVGLRITKPLRVSDISHGWDDVDGWREIAHEVGLIDDDEDQHLLRLYMRAKNAKRTEFLADEFRRLRALVMSNDYDCLVYRNTEDGIFAVGAAARGQEVDFPISLMPLVPDEQVKFLPWLDGSIWRKGRSY